MNQIHKWWGTYFSLQLGWFTSGITNRRTEKCKIIPFCWSLGVALANRDGGKHLWKIEWGIRKIEWEWRGEDRSTKKRQECGDEMLEQEKWLQHTRKSGEALCIKKDISLPTKGERWWKRGWQSFLLSVSAHFTAMQPACWTLPLLQVHFYPFSFQSHPENCMGMWIPVFISKSLAGITWLETWEVDSKNSSLRGKENIFEIALMKDDPIIYVEQPK